MTKIKRTKRQSGRLATRYRPHFDGLEFRLALSGAGSSLVGGSTTTTPAAIVAGSSAFARVEASSQTLTVVFAQPLDSFSIGSHDFAIVHVAADGSTTPLAAREATLTESFNRTDLAPNQITVNLSQPLSPGSYQLVLTPNAQLSGKNGTVPASTRGVVAGFKIANPGVGLADATDLGTITPVESVRSDVLDLADNHAAVDLYRIDLAPGHFWRLGLEVTPGTNGGSLTSALSLFDASGHPIQTATQGRTDAPLDPYLFAGLAPGMYYVGVSGAGNVPGTPGGYDPATSQGGAPGVSQPGGAFELHAVADPADAPTSVLSLRVDHADPGSAIRTGLTIQFSGSLSEAGLKDVGQPAVTAVDATGRVWPLTTIQYDESLAQLSLAFNQVLPAGSYQIMVAPTGGVVDLAGLTPVAAGQPAGVLGVITVATSRQDQGDLGPILPGLAATGVTGTTTIAPGGSVAERFAVVEPGVYAIGGMTPGLEMDLRPLGAGDQGTIPLLAENGEFDVQLAGGAYTLTLTNPGTTPVLVSPKIWQKTELLESLVESGVSQGPALGLRLIAPVALSGSDAGGGATLPASTLPADLASGGAVAVPASTAGSAAGFSGTPGGAGLGPQPAAIGGPSSPTEAARGPAGAPTSVGDSTTPGGPSGSYVLVGNLVGHPSAQSDHVSVVGPSGTGGSLALASNGAGLPAGLIARPGAAKIEGNLVASHDSVGLVQPATEPIPEAALGDQADRILAERDRQTATGGDWLDKILSWSQGWIGSDSRPAPEATVVVQTVPATASDVTGNRGSEAVESRADLASVASPVAFGVLAMVAYQYRKLVGTGSRVSAKPRVTSRAQPILKGPHRRRVKNSIR